MSLGLNYVLEALSAAPAQCVGGCHPTLQSRPQIGNSLHAAKLPKGSTLVEPGQLIEAKTTPHLWKVVDDWRCPAFEEYHLETLLAPIR